MLVFSYYSRPSLIRTALYPKIKINVRISEFVRISEAFGKINYEEQSVGGAFIFSAVWHLHFITFKILTYLLERRIV